MYVFFDIGGTKTRVVASIDLKNLLEIERYDTPATYHEGMTLLVEKIRFVSKGRPIKALAGGIRGPLNHEKTGIISEIKLRDWVGRPLSRDIESAFQAPVFLENDTALVGLGEAVYGAGKNYTIVAYHTVSTGVGGVRCVDGHIDQASRGFEPGHQILDLDHTVLPRHIPPTLENLISGSALEERRGVKPYDIAQGDHVWEELARYLAAGLKNTIVYWSPDVIVLGGSMIVGDPRIPLEAITMHTKHALGDLLPCPPIVDARFRDDGGLYGGVALLRDKIKTHKLAYVN